jgi:hypothetical protein
MIFDFRHSDELAFMRSTFEVNRESKTMAKLI